MALRRRDAGVQRDRGDEHAAGDEPRDQLRRERPAGARHLGAAGLERVDVLVGRERPAARHVAVADRLPVLREVGLERPRQVEPGEPEPDAGVGGEDPRRRRRREASSRSPASTPPNGASPRRSSTIQKRSGSRSRRGRREPQLELGRRPRASPARAAGSVAEVLTTSRSPGARNCGRSRKRPWTMLPVRAVGDEQADAVAGEPARLGRLVRLEAGGRTSTQRAHAETPTRSRAR